MRMPPFSSLLREEQDAIEDAAEYVADLEPNSIEELMRVVNFTSTRTEIEQVNEHFELFASKQKLGVQQQIVEQAAYHRAHGHWSPTTLKPTPIRPRTVPESTHANVNTSQERMAWRSGLHRGRPEVLTADIPETVQRRRQRAQNVDWIGAIHLRSPEPVPDVHQSFELTRSEKSTVDNDTDVIDLTLESEDERPKPRTCTSPIGLGISVSGSSLGLPSEALPNVDDMGSFGDFQYDLPHGLRSQSWLKRRRLTPPSSAKAGQTDSPCPTPKRARYGALRLPQARTASVEATVVDMTAASDVDSDMSDVDGSDSESGLSDIGCHSTGLPASVNSHTFPTSPVPHVNKEDVGYPPFAAPRCFHSDSHQRAVREADFMVGMPEESSRPQQDATQQTNAEGKHGQIRRSRSFSITSSLKDLHEQENMDMDFDMPSSPTPPSFDNFQDALFDDTSTRQPHHAYAESVADEAGDAGPAASIHPRYASPLFEQREITQLPTPPSSHATDKVGARPTDEPRSLSLQDILDQSKTTKKSATTTLEQSTTTLTTPALSLEHIRQQSSQQTNRRLFATVSEPTLLDQTPPPSTLAEEVDLTEVHTTHTSTTTSHHTRARAPSPVASHPSLNPTTALPTNESIDTATQKENTTRIDRTLTSVHSVTRISRSEDTYTTDPERAAAYYSNGFMTTMHRFTDSFNRLIELIGDLRERVEILTERVDDLGGMVRTQGRVVREVQAERREERNTRGR